MADLTLTSPEFDDGERIPDRYGYDADNVNPPLEIDGVPDETELLALVIDDPDAVEPAGKVWDHWIVWNSSPERTTIPEDWDPSEDGAEEGTNDYGESGYGGPKPPNREHTYRFKLYALESAIEGDVVAEARLEGTYPAE